MGKKIVELPVPKKENKFSKKKFYKERKPEAAQPVSKQNKIVKIDLAKLK